MQKIFRINERMYWLKFTNIDEQHSFHWLLMYCSIPNVVDPSILQDHYQQMHLVPTKSITIESNLWKNDLSILRMIVFDNYLIRYTNVMNVKNLWRKTDDLEFLNEQKSSSSNFNSILQHTHDSRSIFRSFSQCTIH